MNKRILRKLYQRLFAKPRVHFLHIGKTGGSAVTYVLKKYKTRGRYELVIHSHHTKFRDIPSGEKIIFFLRDPVTRFVSGFYSRQRQGQPRYFSPWSEDEKIVFERFETPEQLALALSSDAQEEVQAARHAMGSIVHVKDHYWNWFDNVDYCQSRLGDISFVGFQERLAEDFDALKSRLGLPDSLALPDDDVHAHKSPGHLDKSLSDAAVRNLRDWYRGDYEFMEFCRQQVLRERG